MPLRLRKPTWSGSSAIRQGADAVEKVRGIDALRELLFAEMEVLHEIDGRQDRGAYADLGDVLFDLVLAVEVRDARLSIGGAGRGEDEMYACGLGRLLDYRVGELLELPRHVKAKHLRGFHVD